MMVTKVKVKSDDGDVRTNRGLRHPPPILSHSGNTTTPVTMVTRDGVTKGGKEGCILAISTHSNVEEIDLMMIIHILKQEIRPRWTVER
ncbi:hypothetical protein M8C21_029165 [Ambrosia artemisiifolia]|uniref:Uncharacterized protein n=1 Tax=Ambrosia artemisiifolia TaxID=4212 RepID=A0AAD5DE23_AMBAR|nr:hypothetical protein M8C21_029165 [Ambrosia artemisiifolia]